MERYKVYLLSNTCICMYLFMKWNTGKLMKLKQSAISVMVITNSLIQNLTAYLHWPNDRHQ